MIKRFTHRKVTREEVARLAGTSVAVVSYVVNNGPRPVAELTRQRVLEAIALTGYQPNSIARALASGTTRTYGVVVADISNPFIASQAHALLQESVRHGHIMLLGDSGNDYQRERDVILNLLSRQVDGLVYISVDRHPHYDIIRGSDTPLVMLDGVSPEEGISVVRVDERQAAKEVTAHLLSHGYQQAGIVSGPPDMLNSQDRMQGWLDAMNEQQLPVNSQWIIPTEYSREGGYRAARQLIDGGDLPRALFISSESMAIGCLRAFKEEGIRIPQDLAIVCFNGTDQAAYQMPSLTSVRQPIGGIAAVAIQMLREWQSGGQLTEMEFYLETGESCGCCPEGRVSERIACPEQR